MFKAWLPVELLLNELLAFGLFSVQRLVEDALDDFPVLGVHERFLFIELTTPNQQGLFNIVIMAVFGSSSIGRYLVTRNPTEKRIKSTSGHCVYKQSVAVCAS
ncbi:MAG: hypothetical protein DHS20C11_26040 [Lysobacteraceae bacterium]|nr:MAG: hypothetical protein DHS20C11_26040 [Xanthomonadaceae bacterium]